MPYGMSCKTSLTRTLRSVNVHFAFILSCCTFCWKIWIMHNFDIIGIQRSRKYVKSPIFRCISYSICWYFKEKQKTISHTNYRLNIKYFRGVFQGKSSLRPALIGIRWVHHKEFGNFFFEHKFQMYIKLGVLVNSYSIRYGSKLYRFPGSRVDVECLRNKNRILGEQQELIKIFSISSQRSQI